MSTKRRMHCFSLSSAAFLPTALTCTTVNCARFSSWITSALSLRMSQTHMNSASRQRWKNCSRMWQTRAMADLPRGTWQFSMSQKTPMGRGEDHSSIGAFLFCITNDDFLGQAVTLAA
uniref:Putative secreted protein n=1 Tax=Ixodes ricinus TaxID=34613 RepID=A0A147BRN8_IXORI